MTEYKENITGNQRYIIHETYIKTLPQILTQGLSRMERNHIHLCKQTGGTWIRRKKRTNIVIYIDVKTAREDGLKFYSAPNEVIMCSGNIDGYIPIKYFKEIKNIQTGEQIEFNKNTPKPESKSKSLSALAQGFVPNQGTKLNVITETNKSTIQQDCTKYCGQAYNELQSSTNILAEQHEYKNSLTSMKTNINILHDIHSINNKSPNPHNDIPNTDNVHETANKPDNTNIPHSTYLPNKNQAIPTPVEEITETQKNIQNGCRTCTSYKQSPIGECKAARITCYKCHTIGHLGARCTRTKEQPRENSEITTKIKSLKKTEVEISTQKAIITATTDTPQINENKGEEEVYHKTYQLWRAIKNSKKTQQQQSNTISHQMGR